MELRQLRYLLSVIDLGTFAAAGEQAHVSQPALWQQVRSLEQEWQIRLFERAGRRVRPTPAARSLAPRIRSILESSEQIQTDVEAIRSGSAIPARYAAPQYARSAEFIFAAIASYRARYPHAPAPIPVPLGTAGTLEALATGLVDVSGGVTPPDWPFEAEPVYPVWLAALGPAVGDVATIEMTDLADVPLALMTPAFQSRRLVEEVFQRHDLRPVVLLEHEAPAVLVAAARAGLATAVLVSDALPIEPDLPVAEVRDGGRRLGGMLSIVWRDDASLSPAARQLKDEMVAVARRLRGDPTAASPRAPGADAPRRSKAARGRCTRGEHPARPGT
jgi:DNA-binding transcriptional LysR family regulator